MRGGGEILQEAEQFFGFTCIEKFRPVWCPHQLKWQATKTNFQLNYHNYYTLYSLYVLSLAESLQLILES